MVLLTDMSGKSLGVSFLTPLIVTYGVYLDNDKDLPS